MNTQFIQDIQQGYAVKDNSIQLGAAMLDGVVIAEAPIQVSLKMMNRHGLIAGATGTGKTKTLQLITECLSESGVPTLVMDIKGDLSGLAAAGSSENFILERYEKLKLAYEPQAYPVELMTLSNDAGTQMRATVSELGPILLSKVLDLNDTQQGIISVLFKYADDNGLLLLDFSDLIKLLQYATEEGKADIENAYGKLSGASIGTILRKVIALQQQGVDHIFGEPSFDVQDLMRFHSDGRGYINVLRLTNMQDKPAVFSTFMLQLLAELYQTLPESGDLPKPKLVLFIDEAHLIFKDASKELLSQLETTVKLIRSKGVGIFFCTQNPTDVPASILSQLGMKVQHALRAFTANDRKAIKQTADNYPLSNYYKTETLLTSVGIGEAVVTLLNEKGVPTPLAHVFLKTPRSRMDVLTDAEIQTLTNQSALRYKYQLDVNRESAYEILERKIQQYQPPVTAERKSPGRPKAEKSTWEKMVNSSAGKQVQRSLVRGIFNTLSKMFK